MESLIPILKEFGPYVTIILFFVYRDYRRETGQVAYTQQLVKNLVDIATQYSTVTQACIESTNASTRTAGKTYKLVVKLVKSGRVQHPPSELDSMMEDSEDDILPTSQNLAIVDPHLAVLNLNLIPKELKYDTSEVTKAKR